MKVEEICDFCSSPDVQWAFPARNFSRDVPGLSVKVPFNSLGSWAACPVCHALIMRGDRDRLAKRSAKKQKLRSNSRVPLHLMVGVIRELHDTFWSNREGDPVPTRPGDPDPFEETHG